MYRPASSQRRQILWASEHQAFYDHIYDTIEADEEADEI
tara:strand:- start:23054 stop:23170 length:117 start_codon:yes stop_codon:yes gene_type:complete